MDIRPGESRLPSKLRMHSRAGPGQIPQLFATFHALRRRQVLAHDELQQFLKSLFSSLRA